MRETANLCKGHCLLHLSSIEIYPRRFVVLEPLLFLVKPEQNYVAYLEHYLQRPGIPFLLPHIRDQKQHGESMLYPLVQYLQTREQGK